MKKKPVIKEEIEIKSEPIDEELITPVKSLKRKNEEIEEQHNSVLTLVDGISAAEDGTVIRQKKKKKILTEDRKMKLEQEQVTFDF